MIVNVLDLVFAAFVVNSFRTCRTICNPFNISTSKNVTVILITGIDVIRPIVNQ